MPLQPAAAQAAQAATQQATAPVAAPAPALTGPPAPGGRSAPAPVNMASSPAASGPAPSRPGAPSPHAGKRPNPFPDRPSGAQPLGTAPAALPRGPLVGVQNLATALAQPKTTLPGLEAGPDRSTTPQDQLQSQQGLPAFSPGAADRGPAATSPAASAPHAELSLALVPMPEEPGSPAGSGAAANSPAAAAEPAGAMVTVPASADSTDLALAPMPQSALAQPWAGCGDKEVLTMMPQLRMEAGDFRVCQILHNCPAVCERHASQAVKAVVCLCR